MPSTAALSLGTFKWICFATIFAITALCGFTPLMLKARCQKKFYTDGTIALFSCFTGGVFLGAGMLHMLPDALEDARSDGLVDAFQVGGIDFLFCSVCLGFSLMFIIETIGRKKQAHRHGQGPSAPEGGSDSSSVELASSSQLYAQLNDAEPIPKFDDMQFSVDESALTSSPSMRFETITGSEPKQRQHHEKNTSAAKARSVPLSQPFLSMDGISNDQDLRLVKHPDAIYFEVSRRQTFDGSSQAPKLLTDKELVSLDALLVTFIFSLHSLLAGISLGTQTRFTSGTWSIAIAIFAHKGVEAFVVGQNFAKQQGKVKLNRALPSICLYTLMTPLGIVLGNFVSGALESTAASTLEICVQAVSAGSFLFFASHEVEEAYERCPSLPTYLVFLAFLGGLGAMVLLSIFV